MKTSKSNPKKIEANFESSGLDKAQIMGISVFGGLIGGVITLLKDKWHFEPSSRPFFITTINSEFLVIATEDTEFRAVLQKSDLALADSAGLKLLGVKRIIPGRILVENLLRLPEVRPFFLGGEGGVSQRMKEMYGGSADAGHPDIASGRFDKVENSRIISKIERSGANLLLVAYGAPWQEKWIYDNLARLRVGVVVGVGGTFDYLTGRAKSPPILINRIGFEWLWRLVWEPWRWKRQTRLIKFVFLCVFSKFK